MTIRWQPWAALLFAAAVTAAMMLLWQSQIEAPPGAMTDFRQERAFETLSKLLKEQVPHVAGAAENKVIRDRIVAAFDSYGYKSEIQAAFACGAPDRFPGCTQIENIIAVKKGAGAGKAVLVTSHYDSVAAGPGVGDDGAGTAVVLELARAYAERQTKNDLIFLITDGEETGLRGAVAFANKHPLMKTVGIVTNFEARGASGPSMMFETGPGNANLIELYASAVRRPVANSLIYEIYKLLPNDTDFTIYRERGLGGFNFAFSGSASLYHSERDNLANLNRDTLQHHGDNAFAIVGALADADLESLKSNAEASYFDMHGRGLVVWPAGLNLPLSLGILLAIGGLIVVNRDAFTFAAAGWAATALIAVPLLLFAVGWLLAFPLGVWSGAHPIDHPEPWPGRIALLGAAIFVALLVATVTRRVDMRALLLVNWLMLAVLGVALAALVTGASFLFMWPALAFVLAGWIEAMTRRSLAITAIIGFVLAAFFWVPYLMALELVLSWSLSQFKILVLFPFVLALVPIFAMSLKGDARAWIPLVAPAFVMVAAAAVAYQTPAYSANHPRGQNIVYYDDKSASPRWIVGFVGAPDEAYLKANGFPDHAETYKPFGLLAESEERFKPARDLKLEAPTLTVTGARTVGERQVVDAVLRGARGGLQLALGFPPNAGVRALRVEGEEVVSEARFAKGDPVVARVLGLGDRDIAVEVTVDRGATPALTVIERSPLPDGEEPRALEASRANNAAQVHGGDNATVFVRVDLKAPNPP